MTGPGDWTEVISLDHLMTTHGQEMVRRGGAPDPGKPGCVEGALGTAWLAEKYATGEIANVIAGFIFACFALRGLALNHCLTDGNKRLAWIAFIETLAALQLTVDVDEMEAAAFVTTVIVDHLTGEDVARWAEARLAVLDLGRART
jgi:prophage maintenance system killer protein